MMSRLFAPDRPTWGARIGLFFGIVVLSGCIGTDLVGEVPEEGEPERITVMPGETALVVGESAQYQATFYQSDGTVNPTVTFEWRSSDPTIATVDSEGRVAARTLGQASITAHAGGVDSEPVVLTVVADANQVARVELSPSELVLTKDAQSQLSAQTLNVNGSPVSSLTLNFVSADPAVASVSAAGLVTAVSPGTTTITATADGVSSTPAVVRVLGQEYRGTFRARAGTSYTVSGTAVLQEQDSGSLILRLEDDFSTSSGPGLHVFLSTSDGVTSTSIDLGALRSTSGSQSYNVGTGVDPSRFRWVIIHCVPFNVTFGSAGLS